MREKGKRGRGRKFLKNENKKNEGLKDIKELKLFKITNNNIEKYI